MKHSTKRKFSFFPFLLAALLTSSSSYAQLWWGDEFDGNTLNTSNWNIDQGNGGFGNNELQYYRAQNVSVSGGQLVITARRENFGGNAYTSGKITSSGKRHWGSGWIEARMSIPMGQGLWPAFWMLGTNIGSIGWPKCGEIDIMEHINNENQTHGTIHWDSNNQHVSYGGSVATTPAGWHNYQINWNSTSIRWYVDGVKFWEANIANNINSTEEFHRDFFLILNLAVGGNWPGSPNGSTPFPSALRVDYVRVYQPAASREMNTKEARTFSTDLTPQEKMAPITEEGKGVNVFPNPVVKGNSLTIKVKDYDPTALVHASLVNMEGNVITNSTEHSQTVNLNTGTVPNGYYIVKVANGNNTYSQKVLVQ